MTISEMKRGVDRAKIALENMDRRAGRLLQSFLNDVGEGCILQDVNLMRVEATTKAFSRDKQEIFYVAKGFLREDLRTFPHQL